jgi:AcrR family transcriptional regulator
MARGTAARRWQRRKAERPSELVHAALDLFVERGYTATRLDDVARCAGVSKATVYLYFESKEALFRAVVRDIVVPELARFEDLVRRHRGPTAPLVRELVHRWWRSVGETRLSGIVKLMTAEAGNFPELARFFVDNVVRRARRLFAGVLRRGVARGEFRQCNLNYAVRVLLAPLVFAVIYDRSLRPYDRDPYRAQVFVDTHLEMFLRGISPRSGAR